MSTSRILVVALALGVGAMSSAISTGCVIDEPSDKDERVKGQVNNSLPPGTPGTALAQGKSDASDYLAALDVQSPHPYSNHYDVDHEVDLDFLPQCAYRAQLHFSVLRTERNYDFLTVSASADDHSQRLDGEHDDSWSDWFYIDRDDKKMNVHLESDYSITDHGFEIDQVRWEGAAICPAVAIPLCPEGTVNTNGPRGVCGCPQWPTCVPTGEIEIQRQVSRGFNNRGKLVLGHDAFTTAPGPADGLVNTNIGTVDEAGLLAVVRDAALAGLLDSPGYNVSAEWNEYFRIKVGDKEIVFTTALGNHEPKVRSIIAGFLKLFDCNDGDEPITCGSDYTCSTSGSSTGDCVENVGCICTEEYQPVCGTDRKNYSNACHAGCAGVGIKHDGVCGSDGDFCGGIAGWPCAPDFKCFGMGDYPDASGTCRAETYCELPVHCEGLSHIATRGQWACEMNECAWVDGSPWQRVTDGELSTAHPYSNDANTWKKLYLPAGATALRLSTTAFTLEDGYDFLEVWSWIDGAWQRVARYTGVLGPREVEFEGRYHYLHFVSDYSVTDYGFELFSEYR